MSESRVPPLPPIGACVLKAWHVADGATIEEGQLLAEVESDKALLEWRAPQAGVMLQRLAAVGDHLREGAPLARLDVGPVQVELLYRSWK